MGNSNSFTPKRHVRRTSLSSANSNKTKDTDGIASFAILRSRKEVLHSATRKAISRAVATYPECQVLGVALRFFHAQNAQNTIRVYQAATHDALFYFEEVNVIYPMRTYWESMLGLFDAMPDMQCYFKTIKIKDDSCILEGVVEAGHHTGSPISLPNQNEKANATGAFLENDAVRMIIKVSGDKVSRVTLEGGRNGLVGPVGFYINAIMAWEKTQPKLSRKKLIQRLGVGNMAA